VISNCSSNTTEELSNRNLQTLLKEFENLDPISPEEAIELYIDSRKDEITQSTANDYQNSLEYFADYCEISNINNLNDFGGRQIVDYSNWRKNKSSDKVDSLAKKTMRDELYLLANFLKFVEKIEGVKKGTAEKVDPPTLKSGEGVRNVELEIEYLGHITSYLAKYHYSSREHVVIKIFEETGRRLGGVHSLDLCDAHLDTSDPYLEFRHHDDRNTRLKNGKKSEQPFVFS